MRIVLAILLTLPLLGHAQIPFGLSDHALTQVTSELRKGLVGYWRLEESTGTRLDESSYGNHLTSNNSVGQAAGVSGYTGNCASFVSASSQSLTSVSSNFLQFSVSQPWSISAWTKLTNNAADQAIAGHFKLGGKGYFLSTFQGKPYVQIQKDASNYRFIIGTTVITNATWKHIVATYDGSVSTNGFKLYVNGALETVSVSGSAGTVDAIENASVWCIGNFDNTSATTFARGLIDEVSIWTRVLTATGVGSVSQLYNAGLGTHFPWAHP